MSETTGDAIELDPTRYTRRELLQAAKGEHSTLHPVIAVALLARKRYSQDTKHSDLASILDEQAMSPRARTAAAVELGRLGTEAAEGALTSRRRSENPVIERAAAAGLRELERLRGIDQRATMAAALEADDPPRLFLDEQRARPITLRAVSKGEMSRVVDHIGAELRALGLDPATGRVLKCTNQRLVFVGMSEFGDQAEGGGSDSAAVAGVLATQDTEETGRWSTRYFVVATVSHDGEHDIKVVTRRGRQVLVGRGRQSADGFLFELRAVAGPGSAPAVVEGRYRAGKLDFTRALAEPVPAARLIARPRARTTP